MKNSKLLLLLPLLTLTSCNPYSIENVETSEYIETYIRYFVRENASDIVHVQTEYEIEKDSKKFAWVDLDEKEFSHSDSRDAKVGDQLTIAYVQPTFMYSKYVFVCWGWNNISWTPSEI